MKSQRSIRIFCRHLRPFRSKPTYFRTASSSARTIGDTFNASKLLLDLDAANSPYVRKYEEQPDDEVGITSRPSNLREYNPPQDGQKTKGHPAFTQNLMRPNAWRPTGADYLNLALVGNPYLSKAGPIRQLRQVLKMNMIPPISDFKRLIDLLIATTQAGYDAGSGAHPSVPEDQKASMAREQISKCTSITELGRYLAMMTDIQSRAESLSLGSGFVVEGIMRCRSNRRATRLDVLKTINAVVQKLESKGLGPGAALCDAGMYFAGAALNLPALKKYIEMATTRNYPATYLRSKVAYDASRRFVGNSTIPGRTGLLRLLTGWENGGVPAENEERKPCLACFPDLKGNDAYPNLYHSYLMGLVRLGAPDALWYEWTHPPTWLPPPMEETEQVKIKLRRPSRFEVVYDAFIAMKSQEHARRLFESS